MSDLNQERNELLNAVKAPERKKKEPNNYALHAAIVFSNLIFCLLDAISGITVYWMTNFILYGILTFLAGFVPLLLHEFLFVRAFASETQKKIAVTGAVISLTSIVLIGVLAGYVNVVGMSVNAQGAEIAVITILVLIAAFHAILTAVYFYIDLGIKAEQATAQAVARAKQQSIMIKAGSEILSQVQLSVSERKRIGNMFDHAALNEVLLQMGFPDANHDGIPDVLQQQKPQQQQRPMQQYASEASKMPVTRDNGNGSHSDPNS